MNTESESDQEHSEPAAAVPDDTTTESTTTQPWVSILAIVACVGIFLGLLAKNDYQSWETLSKFGYLPAHSIWKGGYWALITSAFVHVALWHLSFNVYWLWVLGSRLERAIGSLRFLAFFILSAFVSSSFQLAASDSTGIGASGLSTQSSDSCGRLVIVARVSMKCWMPERSRYSSSGWSVALSRLT